MKRDTDRGDLKERRQVTPEVGDEGGTPGNVEIGSHHVPGTGSEADETWRPDNTDKTAVHRDETGRGRRSP